MPNKTKLSVELDDPSLHRALKAAAAERGTTMRDVVVQALREWLERQEEEEDIAAIREVEDSETIPWEQAKAEIRQQWATRDDA